MSSSSTPIAGAASERTSALARPREGVTHHVKSWPALFEATRRGEKKHELRRTTDRDYRVGDILTLQEYDPETTKYTGRELSVRITYVTSARTPCALSDASLDPDYCILSVAPI
jgi:hypothetical protein